jgi:uncharacterized protein
MKAMLRYLAVPLFALSLVALAQVDVERRTINVVGSGTAFGEPDTAFFEAGVNLTAEELGPALAQANETIANVMTALQEAGVSEQDMRTVSFSVWREERYGPAGEQLAPVYRIVNMMRVTVRESAALSDLLGRATETGANAIGNVQYTISNPEALESRAREEAMRLARARALQLAQLAGVPLGAVRSVIELPASPVYPAAPRVMAEDLAVGVPVAGGQLEVVVTLQVSFEIGE